jgi:hypothetical protein
VWVSCTQPSRSLAAAAAAFLWRLSWLDCAWLVCCTGSVADLDAVRLRSGNFGCVSVVRVSMCLLPAVDCLIP